TAVAVRLGPGGAEALFRPVTETLAATGDTDLRAALEKAAAALANLLGPDAAARSARTLLADMDGPAKQPGWQPAPGLVAAQTRLLSALVARMKAEDAAAVVRSTVGWIRT